MHGLLAIVTGWLIAHGATIVIKILLGLGISWATFSGVDFIVTAGENYIFSQFTGIPSDAYAIARIAGFDQGIRIIFAAWSTFVTLKVTMGAYSRWGTNTSTFRA